MVFKKRLTLVIAASAMAILSAASQAQTVRIGNQGDSLSMDPHSLSESVQLSVIGRAHV